MVETGENAHSHVVPGDVVHERMHESAQRQREPGTVGLVEQQHLVSGTAASQLAQGLVIKMMQEKIRHKHPALVGWRCEKIALPPVDAAARLIVKPWPRGQIERRQVHARMSLRDPPQEACVASAPLVEAACHGIREPCQAPQIPALVAHQEVDSPQVGPAAQRGRIIDRKMIQPLGLHAAIDHAGH